MCPSDPGDPKRTVVDGTLGYEDRDEASAPAPPGWEALLAASSSYFEGRYTQREEIGRGGVGRVLLVDDRLMGRSVAMKALHEEGAGSSGHPARVRRFFAEAQTTAQLEHPNVVPVYELGEQPGGAPYFTMKRVRGRAFSQSIADYDGLDDQRRYGLLQIFQQICMAVDYAHSKGVVHRDLKPDNVMVGDFGEVLVMDWGIARTRQFADVAATADPIEITGEQPGGLTMDGAVVGTPGYMPPEQAIGDTARVDARSDVWALGAILYEILTGEIPFTGHSAFAVLIATVNEDIVAPTERAPERAIPRDLEEICLRCLRRDPEERYQRVGALRIELDRYLAGTRERERRTREAAELVRDGEESLFFLKMLGEERATLETDLAALPPLSGQEPLEEKRARWAVEARLEEVQSATSAAFAAAESKFLRATEIVPDHRAARAHLADMYWDRYRAARTANDHRAAQDHLKVVGRFSDRGSPRLATQVPLTLVTDPPGAEVTLYRYVERDRILVPSVPRPLGPTPLEGVTIPTGRQLLEIVAPGRAPVRLPVMAWQGDELRFEVRIPGPEELEEEFVFVPGGPYARGNDQAALLAAPGATVEVAPFAIGRFPVTCEAYFAFLDSLPPEEALRRAPREAGRPVVGPHEDGRWRAPVADKDGDVWHPRWPIFSVSHGDACAYAEWRSEREGALFRLPTEDEWEKAARGPDGRFFPWGDYFDPSFCANRGATPGDEMPKVVGRFPADTSPYGVRDLAGGVREWTSGWFEPGELRTIRGGAFNHYAFLCRAASRFGAAPRRTQWAIGFRLVKVL